MSWMRTRRASRCSLIGGNGRLDVSYPIAPTDIVDILPLVKHGASMGGNSFVPCSFDGSAGNHSLHVLLNDVRMIYDAAHSRLSNEWSFYVLISLYLLLFLVLEQWWTDRMIIIIIEVYFRVEIY